MWIQPTAEQLQQLSAFPGDDPVVMLNLLKFKERADGIDAGASGAEAYARYGQGTEPHLRGVGGRVLMAFQPQQSVIGPEQSEWDLVILVEYPSRTKFLEMAGNPDYIKVHAHREAAVADSRLIACSQLQIAQLTDADLG